jgi:hypothetical protein
MAVALHRPKPSQDVRKGISHPCVHGNVVDVSKASSFFQKEAAIAEVLTNHVEKLPQSRYLLKNGFENFFFNNLDFVLNREAEPADAIAHSLFRLAQHWVETTYVDSLPGEGSSVSSAALDREWKRSWERMPTKLWDAFEQMSRPEASYIITALDDKGTVDDELTYLSTVRHVALGISFAQDLKGDPEMRLLVKGDPAVSFMMAYIRKSQLQVTPENEKEELRSLRTIFDSVVSRIAKEFLGLTRKTVGRPRVLANKRHI